MLCSIADVYDAMRSQRSYQQAFPTDRILAVLKRNDGTQFDQHLVRRFVQLLGIYPAGNLVRLNTGEVGGRAQACTRPIRTGRTCACSSTATARGSTCRTTQPLGDEPTTRQRPSAIVAPVDPADYAVRSADR